MLFKVFVLQKEKMQKYDMYEIFPLGEIKSCDLQCHSANK